MSPHPGVSPPPRVASPAAVSWGCIAATAALEQVGAMFFFIWGGREIRFQWEMSPVAKLNGVLGGCTA